MTEIIYFYGNGPRPRRKVFREQAPADAFHQSCVTAGIPIRLARTTYHAKVDGRTGEVVQEWTSSQFTKEGKSSVRIFHDGAFNGFGRSRKSPEEARQRAKAALAA